MTVAVSAGAGCGWTATSNESWITITDGASGSGNGTVRFNVESTNGKKRNGTLTIAGRTFKVDQDKKNDHRTGLTAADEHSYASIRDCFCGCRVGDAGCGTADRSAKSCRFS